MFHRLIAYVAGIAARRRIDDEARDELAFHLAQETDANVARGMEPSEARRLALATLGGIVQPVESIRDVRQTPLDALWRDVRHACRSLAAAPSFTIAALAVLVLTVGAATAMFSIVDGVVLRELPFPRADRVVAVTEYRVDDMSGDRGRGVAPQNFLDWREQQQAFTGLAAIGYASVSLRPEPGQEPETLMAQAVTADFFRVLGVPPMVGRTFDNEHEQQGHAMVAVISYGLWQRRFGGDPDVTRRLLRGQRGDFEILGVMPPSFEYPVGDRHPTDVWLPNVFRAEERVRANEYSYRLQVIGRLRDDVRIEQAREHMDRIMAGLAAKTPHWFVNRVAGVEPLRAEVARSVRRWMFMLLAAVGCVLLIGCINLANLMLVRATARTREFQIRTALGASHWTLVRGLLVESLIVSLAGSLLGALAAWLAVEWIQAVVPANVPRVAGIAIDGRVLAAVLSTATAIGLLFGLAPIAHLRRTHTAGLQMVKVGAATAPHERLRSLLIVGEVALAVVLLVGGGLFLMSFVRVSTVNLGIDQRGVLAVRVRPLVGSDNWTLAQQHHRGWLREMLDDVRGVPGIASAALVSGGVPLRGDLRTVDLAIPGKSLPRGEDLDFNEVSPGYFSVMRVPLLKGRDFTDRDTESSEAVVIINKAAADHYFPDEDPIGRTIDFSGHRRIVGIAGNIRHDGPETDWRRQGFIPLAQSAAVGATIVARLSADPGSVLPPIKSAIWARFPALALPDVEMLSHYFDRIVAPRRFNMLLLGTFALLGIVIACVGIYGVMAYSVVLRVREIGIRLALGAAPLLILWVVFRRTLMHVGLGLTIGLLAAAGLSRLVVAFLFEIDPHDMRVYAVVSAALVLAALAAAFVPARRAASVDPLVALRME